VRRLTKQKIKLNVLQSHFGQRPNSKLTYFSKSKQLFGLKNVNMSQFLTININHNDVVYFPANRIYVIWREDKEFLKCYFYSAIQMDALNSLIKVVEQVTKLHHDHVSVLV
jgi:hypothetical protein